MISIGDLVQFKRTHYKRVWKSCPKDADEFLWHNEPYPEDTITLKDIVKFKETNTIPEDFAQPLTVLAFEEVVISNTKNPILAKFARKIFAKLLCYKNDQIEYWWVLKTDLEQYKSSSYLEQLKAELRSKVKQNKART